MARRVAQLIWGQGALVKDLQVHEAVPCPNEFLLWQGSSPSPWSFHSRGKGGVEGQCRQQGDKRME